LTRPEPYGEPLPLKDTVILGEEITIVFSEYIQCEKPYTFDLKVIIEETGYEFDREELQVVCEGRKISFQIDPTVGIDVESVMGKKFSVELGRIGVESVSNVFDINGNSLDPLKGNIFFEKTLADLNLDEASTTFTFTLEDLDCSEESADALTMEVKERIVDILGLPTSDIERVDIKDVSCIDGQQVNAAVILLPSLGTGRFLRTRALLLQEDEKDHHSVALYQQLLEKSDMSKVGGSISSPISLGDRKLAKEKEDSNDGPSATLLFTLSNMKIVPAASDIKAFATKHELMEEEEELYNFASSSGTKDEAKDVVIKKTDRKALVEELQISTRNIVEEIDGKHEENLLKEIHSQQAELNHLQKHEENLLKEIHRQQAELNHLQMEFCVIAIACVMVGTLSLIKLKG